MNATDLSAALHIITGDSAGGSLKQALRLSSDRLLINDDPIHCGPAPATDDLQLWRSVRERFIADIYSQRPDFSFGHYDDVSLLKNATKLSEAPQIVVWAACGLAEQLLLAWVVFLFDRLGFDLSKLSAIQFTDLRPGRPAMLMGELSPENIQRLNPGARPLQPEQADELRGAWRAYTDSHPAILQSYLEEPGPLPLLQSALRHFIYRYPAVASGLTFWDELLLRNIVSYGPLPARVIGYTLSFDETADVVGDAYLFHRLVRLGSPDLPSPLVSFTGDTRAMRTCSVEITDFGRKVLAGEANHVTENGIDDWVGGVHLTPDTVVFRDGDRLLLS